MKGSNSNTGAGRIHDITGHSKQSPKKTLVCPSIFFFFGAGGGAGGGGEGRLGVGKRNAAQY